LNKSFAAQKADFGTPIERIGVDKTTAPRSPNAGLKTGVSKSLSALHEHRLFQQAATRIRHGWRQRLPIIPMEGLRPRGPHDESESMRREI
jgi:hypothetical protein